MTLSMMVQCCYAVSFVLPVVYAECRKLAIMLSVIMLNVIMVSVIILSVVVPVLSLARQ
jgi:hypothetical protein